MTKKKANELNGWFDAINASQDLARQDDEQWRQEMGKPGYVMDIEGGKLGFWRLENGDVLTARIVKDRAIRNTAQVYARNMIMTLAELSKM
jgi:hypothetical protein